MSACQIYVFVLWFLITWDVCYNISTANYEKTDSGIPDGYGEIQTFTSLPSKLSCAAKCDLDASCKYFLFDLNSTSCILVGVSNVPIPTSVLSTCLRYKVPSTCPQDFINVLTINVCYNTANYEKTDSGIPDGYGEIQTFTSLPSKLSCAAKCDLDASCKYFLFDLNSTSCILVGVSNVPIPTSVLSTCLRYKVPSTCPQDFINVLTINVCYKIFSTASTWNEANTVCTDQGYELLTLDTHGKLHYFRNVVLYDDDFHIGAAKDGNDFKWLSTGSVVDTHMWGAGMPDNPHIEQCVAITTYGGNYLNDIECDSYRFKFVCEVLQL